MGKAFFVGYHEQFKIKIGRNKLMKINVNEFDCKEQIGAIGTTLCEIQDINCIGKNKAVPLFQYNFIKRNDSGNIIDKTIVSCCENCKNLLSDCK
jgi:hypothetical protein